MYTSVVKICDTMKFMLSDLLNSVDLMLLGAHKRLYATEKTT